MSRIQADLIIRNGTLVLPDRVEIGDLVITNGKIVAIEHDTDATGRREINADRKPVCPGGVDTHCHVEQISGAGLMNADTFETATRSALYGGTTSLVSFAAQHPGHAIQTVVSDYWDLARAGSMTDYALHMILSDISGDTLTVQVPRLIRNGHRSIKIFTTYDKVRQGDEAILRIFRTAEEHDALVCIHAENDGLIAHMTARLLAEGKTEAKYHAQSHPREAEIEAISRMCRFAEFTGTRIMIFHVSTREGVEIVRDAQDRGVLVSAETCPHYLFMTEDILQRDRPERFLCSPPQRTSDDQIALWEGIADRTLQLITSDHAPYRMDETGKFANGDDAPFSRIANGMPGLETRLPLMFNAIVSEGRGDLVRFVELTSTAPARAFGLDTKGSLDIGKDADITIWDPDATLTYGEDDLHDGVGYNPYVGTEVKGLPQVVISRGEVVVDDGGLHATPGRGQWMAMAGSLKS